MLNDLNSVLFEGVVTRLGDLSDASVSVVLFTMQSEQHTPARLVTTLDCIARGSAATRILSLDGAPVGSKCRIVGRLIPGSTGGVMILADHFERRPAGARQEALGTSA